MRIERRPAVSQGFRTLYRVGFAGGLSDGELLSRFATRHGEGAELAFAALVERHGPMVLRVCRSVLRHEQDAQDAMQATFLVLARRAESVRKRESVGSWLYGVALRVAACLRHSEVRRRRHERAAAALARRDGPAEGRFDEASALLHEELGRLPERYREVIVLCHLEGLSCEAAAQRLGWPVGTVKSRLSRGRERLRDRLARRDVFPALPRSLTPTLPAALAERAVRAALGFSTKPATAGSVSAATVALAETLVRRIAMTRLLTTAVGLLLACAVMVGLSRLALSREDVPTPARQAPAPAQEIFTRPYYVGDLLKAHRGNRPTIDMVPLIEILTATVAPGTWRVIDAQGQELAPGAQGPGSITPFFLSLSLIVRHNDATHKQVAERLRQLRRLINPAQAEKGANERVSGEPVATPTPLAGTSEPVPDDRARLRAMERQLELILKRLDALVPAPDAPRP